jgi:hypothetical protein
LIISDYVSWHGFSFSYVLIVTKVWHLTPQEKADLLAFIQALTSQKKTVFTNRTKEEHEQHKFVCPFSG